MNWFVLLSAVAMGAFSHYTGSALHLCFEFDTKLSH